MLYCIIIKLVLYNGYQVLYLGRLLVLPIENITCLHIKHLVSYTEFQYKQERIQDLQSVLIYE
jgi:hypothetical protein